MREDTTIPLRNPALRDELSELLRAGARRIIRQAVEAELAAYLEAHAGDRDAQGRRAVVRNGYLAVAGGIDGSGSGAGSGYLGRGTGRARAVASARSFCRRICGRRGVWRR